MKYRKLRIFVNAIIVILILISRIFIRKKRRIVYFNPETGYAGYITTYYTMLFIPVWFKSEQYPK